MFIYHALMQVSLLCSQRLWQFELMFNCLHCAGQADWERVRTWTLLWS